MVTTKSLYHIMGWVRGYTQWAFIVMYSIPISNRGINYGKRLPPLHFPKISPSVRGWSDLVVCFSLVTAVLCEKSWYLCGKAVFLKFCIGLTLCVRAVSYLVVVMIPSVTSWHVGHTVFTMFKGYDSQWLFWDKCHKVQNYSKSSDFCNWVSTSKQCTIWMYLDCGL